MFVQQARARFRRGLEQLARGRARDALPFIAAAMELQQQVDPAAHGQATYLSYHGLCLCLTRSSMHEGLRRCRQAAEMDPYNPDIWWNLGRVELMIDHRHQAYRAFQRGLEVYGRHRGILRDLARMGIRRRPPLPFLPRRHPLNVMLGRLRGAAAA